MFEELLELLKKYARGARTRGGFSDLELFLARQKQDQKFDPENMIPHLIELIAMPDAGNEQFAMGINLIVQKAGCKSENLRDALERRVIDDGADLDPRSQFELVSALIRAGGDWTPQMLQHLEALRTTKPELWLDLAILAYPFDVQGFTEAVRALLEDNQIGMDWTALKPRYLKLVNATGSEKFNWFAQEIAKSIPEGDRANFISWINGKRGSKLGSKTAHAASSIPPKERVRQEDIDFLTSRPCLAEPVIELEAA